MPESRVKGIERGHNEIAILPFMQIANIVNSSTAISSFFRNRMRTKLCFATNSI